MNRRLLLFACLCIWSAVVSAQTSRPAHDIALQYLRQHPDQLGLNAADVADVRITDEYVSKNNGVTHVWLQQQYLGIPVFNGLIGLHVLTNGEVVYVGHRFVKDLSKHVNTNLPSLSAEQALQMAMVNLGFTGFPVPSQKTKTNERNFVFNGGAISKSEIPVSICYELQKNGTALLAWTMTIQQANTSDIWNMRVNAQTGEILGKINQTVYCKAGSVFAVKDDCSDAEQPESVQNTQQTTSNNAQTLQGAESYRVFALPVESPAHGPRTLLVNPASPIASPYGWLDTDGANGPEFTYTRGNNVWAYDDSANDNVGSPAESADGGPTTTFDFPYDPDAEPTVNKLAAITNLFYMNNALHDTYYQYGFDEPGGNFQDNLYGHPGAGGDEVQAQALDGSGTDNANFATPADGQSGTMQMYTWTRQGGKIVKVNAPGPVLGTYAATVANGWGATITTTPVTGDVVFANDGSAEATLGCNDPVNDVKGKIVMVDRGVCEFGHKALKEEQAGAIGCIICNFEDGTIGMASGAEGASVTIPVVMMKKSDCDLLRQYAGSSLNISLVEPLISGPNLLDGDFDNGIIAHEYFHGVSTRLTGGPANSGCLGNAEEMGEGWSDWSSLINTVKPGDVGTKKRGVGTFVLRQDNDAQGIRRYPYSTDMNINPLTFSTVAENTEVHALGEVWTAMVWDLYWALVEKYGYDSDLTNHNSGNAHAIQLVLDGCKLQPCSPGFVDGRNAIMTADKIDYNGADTCLISSVFARRGLGYFASQGVSDNAADGVENFDPIPTCVKELKIKKVTSTPIINPGGFADYTITVTNHKDNAATGVVVSDEIPAGLTFVSASNGGAFAGGYVVWNLGTMQTGQVITLTYRLKAANGVGSLCYFRDPMDTEDDWFSVSIETNGAEEYFALQGAQKKVGTGAWFAPESATANTDMTLETIFPITIVGTRPVLRFWHQYDTEAGADAGFVEVQLVNDPSMQWRRFNADKVFRGPYDSKVQYGTFAIPFLSGFSGYSNGWKQSYIDMSDYINQDINLRFRFGTDNNNASTNGGWYVDEVQLIDLVSFNSDACVQSSEGDHACANVPQGGVFVDTDCTTIGTEEPGNHQIAMKVQPNPAHDAVSVILNETLAGSVRVSLVGAEGRVVLQRTLNGAFEGQILTLDVNNVPAGVYLVRVESDKGNNVMKVVIQ